MPADTMIPIASGRYARPALIALYPSTCCMYSEMKKNIENSDIAISSATMLMPVIVRRRKIANGTSGAFERSSMTMNAARSASATAPSPSVWPESQPASLASTSV